ncbi:hypothetical protein BG011_006686 [Mortierella polycephala]|uniref:AB hydrolase-1 domain-containing protein n=1 Tax=Mortierella polycephala TaxID=41804 RepID=A0A9P6PVJ2_9FUNG|nr:hypothetical protein BG011_006686 [Mortierella polycephala]
MEKQKASANVPAALPYANPAATQFLRLGVGIDHIDVEDSDEDDVIYQGIENDLSGHTDQDDSVTEDDEDTDEDTDTSEDERNRTRSITDSDNTQQPQQRKKPHQANVEADAEDSTVCTQKDNIINRTSNSVNKSTPGCEPIDAQNNCTPAEITINTPASPSVTLHSGTTPTPSLSSPSTTTARHTLSNINTRLNSGNSHTRLSTKQRSPGSPTSPTSPTLAKGLPIYHEKFTKASLNKIHGTSPLSDVNNTFTAQSSAEPNTEQQSRNSAHPSTRPIEDNTHPAPLQVRRFAEKKGFITIHSWKIHYKVCYPTLDPFFLVNGKGRNIVLFHGALSNLNTWRNVQQNIADRTGCRVLAYDRVGHGLSDKPSRWPKNANPYKNGGVLAICQSLLDVLGMHQNLILIGNGTGATIAAALALTKPLAVRGLVLVAPSILDESPPLYLRACVSYPPPLSWIYRGLYGDHGPLQQLYCHPKAVMEDPSTMEMYMRPYKTDGFWRGLSNTVKYRSSFKIEERLNRLAALATLVVTGDVDDTVPTIETLRLFEKLQGVRQQNVPQVLKTIKQVGHLPQEEKALEFVKVITFFIKKVCLGSLSRERSLGRTLSKGVSRSGSKKSANSQAGSGSLEGTATATMPQGPSHGPNATPVSKIDTKTDTTKIPRKAIP